MIERRRVRTFLVTFAVIGIPLGVLALAGATVALRQLERQRDAQVAQIAGVVAALVGEAQEALRREAVVLARDPALIESAVTGHWGTLARWGAPRILTLTRTGAADLVVVRDARGTPLVQVPPLVRVPPVAAPAPVGPRVSLTLIDDRPYVLVTAALSPSPRAEAAGPSPGTVVIGRRVEALGRALEKLPGRPGLVFVSGDRGLGAARAEAPSGGWTAAVRSGRALLGGEAFALRALPPPESVSSPGALWALVPEADTAGPVRRLWGWLIALSAGGAVILALGVGIAIGAFSGRRTSGAGGAATAPDPGGPGPGSTMEAAIEGHGEVAGYGARALEEVAEIIESALDPRPLLKQVAIATARACHVDRCSIERWDGDQVIALTSQFSDGRRDAGLWAAFTRASNDPPRNAPINARAIETRRPVIVDDVTASDLVPREWIEAFGHKSLMVVPLIRQEHVIGVVTLDYVGRVTRFAPWQVSLATAIARRLSLAIENARLFQDNQRRVEEATRAHAELAAAQDQLVRTEKLRAMGQMASGMAHDFNNVLAAILGRAQLLRARVDDPALRQWLLVIERAAMDGARTVRRLQEFTRIRRDQPVEPVDLNRIVEETLEATEPSWRQASLRRGIAIEVETALAASRPVVSGDPAELREALTNVILNAVDAMPEGGRLRVATRLVDGNVEVSVADTGTGIAEEVRDRIFDPFFTTKGPKGTGLGLSMTYGILARHDGRITVESEEGAGTTFRITFPSTGDAPPVPVPVAAPAAAAVALRCLIVDDEAAVAAVLADMLVAIGHEPTVVGSGAEALARLRAEPFDLVLTDLAMPGMTGWELAAAVKALVPGLPVFLVTGFGVEVPQADLAGHAVDLVLAKPLQIRDVTAALAEVTPRSGGQS